MPYKLLLFLLVIVCLLPFWLGLDLQGDRNEYIELQDSGRVVMLLRWLALTVGVVPIYLVLRNLLGYRMLFCITRNEWLQIRLFFIAVFSGLVVTSITISLNLFPDNRFLHRSLFNSFVGLFLSVWAATLLSMRDSSRSVGNSLGRIELTLFNIIVSLLCVELLLNQFSRHFPTPLLWDQGSIESRIAAHKLTPHSEFFNTRVNSAGYHDSEFFSATDSDYIVAVLADSFGVGIVPHEYNFTSVAESALAQQLGDRYERIAVHNFGVAGTGMDEYAYMLDSQVLQTNPDLVVVAVFIGNDLIDQKSIKRNYYALHNWMTFQLPMRIGTIIRERNETNEYNIANIGSDVKGNKNNLDYIHDWRLEKPSMSKQAFIRFESDRLEICNVSDPDNESLFERFFQLSTYIRQKVKGDLLFVMIPDEFQVNDALYSELVESKPVPGNYQRDYPQMRLGQFFSQNSIEYLDLLPILGEAQQIQPAYHLQDTHWNAWGNRIAGKAIVDRVMEQHIPITD